MDEQLAKHLAAQLRKPHGAEGIATGEWMNKGNVYINLDTIEILQPATKRHHFRNRYGQWLFCNKHPAKKCRSVLYRL